MQLCAAFSGLLLLFQLGDASEGENFATMCCDTIDEADACSTSKGLCQSPGSARLFGGAGVLPRQQHTLLQMLSVPKALRKLSCTSSWKVFIISGVSTITTINSRRASYVAIGRSKAMERAPSCERRAYVARPISIFETKTRSSQRANCLAHIRPALTTRHGQRCERLTLPARLG